MSDSESTASELSQEGSVSADEATRSLPTPSPSKRKRKQPLNNEERNQEMIVQSAFDAYFTQTSARAQTSTSVFSSIVPPLSAEEYIEASSAFGKQTIQSELLSSKSSRKSLFRRLLWELQEGFNILCYGYGSKRALLNDFASNTCSKAGHVVVANAFHNNFGLKELLSCIENVPGITSLPLASSSVENQSRRICDFFAQPSQKRHLYLIIHNIDTPSLRLPKAQACLSLLALNARIHLIASIDHINAPLLWSSAESSARKEDQASGVGTSSRGFAWLWHDMTTLTPYDVELSHADRSSISGAQGGTRKQREAAAQNATTMVSESAALHVLASVNLKAKKLFAMIGTKQLEAIAASGNASSGDNLQQYAIGYDTLFHSARDNFIATNDTALRALLGEFRDHALVVGSQLGSSGEVLWIPMRKERLSKVLGTLELD